MVANREPIFTLTQDIPGVVIGTQNNRSDGNGTIGTDIFLLVSGGADGTYVKSVTCMPVTTTGGTGTNTAATVLRLFVSTASSGATTSSNTKLLMEQTAPVVSAGNSTAAVNPIAFPCDFILPSGEYLLVTTHVANAANTSWQATAIVGNY